MYFSPMHMAADAAEAAGRAFYLFAIRVYKSLRVYATDLRLLSNYRTGIIRNHTPVDIYRRIFFELLFIFFTLFGCAYSAIRYFIQPSYSATFNYKFIQPLHRFIAGEPFSIFWRKDLLHVSNVFVHPHRDVPDNRMHVVSWVLSMIEYCKRSLNYSRRSSD